MNTTRQNHQLLFMLILKKEKPLYYLINYFNLPADRWMNVSLHRGQPPHLSVPVTLILWLLSKSIRTGPWSDSAIWCMLRNTEGNGIFRHLFLLFNCCVSSVHYYLIVLLLLQNGSHILPLLWLGSPMKLSCPVQPASPAPSVFCSSSAMAVQMTGQEPKRQTLGVLGLFFTENCSIPN